MRLLGQLPNLITLLNLLCGCIALGFAFDFTPLTYVLPFAFVALGIFFDFFDGFFARLLKVSSPLGVQLDSLADMVTSGVVPSVVLFHMFDPNQLQSAGLPDWFRYVAFLVALGSCWRLAKFNIDTRQTDHFIGLPTPANALFITALPILKFEGSLLWMELLISPWVLAAVAVFSCFMLNSEIDLFALKFKKKGLKNYVLPMGFVLYSAVLLALGGLKVTPAIILSYIIVSFIANRFRKN